MNPPDRPPRLGTRGSPLALAQARSAAAAIESAHGWAAGTVAIVTVTTTGDRVQDRALAEIGGKALWTKELDRALIDGEVDACVHSMKDVESERPPAFRLSAMLERADVRDRLIGADSIESLRPNARVGTCSPRRTAQLRRLRPDLRIELLRGNVETRLGKVADGAFDATLLAAAGLDRLGIAAGTPLATSQLLPAPGQAAVGIECRADDPQTGALIAPTSHAATFACVAAERAFSRALGGTCASPVAALAAIDDGAIQLSAQIFSADGRFVEEEVARFDIGDEAGPGELARTMLRRAPPSIRTLFDPA